MRKLMVVTLVALVVTGIAFGQPMKARMGGPQKGLSLAEELQLTDQQIAKLDEIQKKYQKKVVKLGAELKLAHLELRDLIENEASQKEIQKALDKVNGLRSKMFGLHIEKKLEIRKVLTEEQKKLLGEKPVRYLLRGYGPCHEMMKGGPEHSKRMMRGERCLECRCSEER